mgnify:FL=1
MRRMDRYNEESNNRPNRYEKNQELYQDIATNQKYTNITDVTNANAFEINNSNRSYTSRESYQQMKKYQNVEPVPRVKKELEDFNRLLKNDEKKVYDINSVLEEARKNRQEQDKLESKRKLKNTSYNILADLNQEELEKYREEKKKKIMTPEEEEFTDLINTIASKTLAGEIDKATSINLLSDLMATSVMDKVEDKSSLGLEEDIEKEKQEKEELEEKEDSEEEKDKTEDLSLSKEKLEEIAQKKEEIEKNTQKLTGADNDFYTRSMDLSDEDFEMDDEFKDTGMPLILKIIIVVLIIALIAVAAYFIYQRM